MRTVSLRRLYQEINEESTAYVGPKYVSRYGIHYSWFNASNLDSGIRQRQDFALEWRKKLIELAEASEKKRITRRTIRVYYSIPRLSVEMTAYSVDGRDALVVNTRTRDMYVVGEPIAEGSKVGTYTVKVA